MKKIFYTIAAAMTLAACSSEDNLTTVNEPENNKVTMTFTASQEGEAGTRAELNAGNRTKINWSENDKISINGDVFTLSRGAGTGNGAFSGTTAEAAKYIAVYPYTGNESYPGEGEVSGVVLPSEQEATAGSFDPKAALMMAVSEDKSLEFKNAVGFIKVTPQFDCKKIILRAADKTVPLAGKGTLKFNVGQPYIDFTNSTELSYTITLSGTITDGNDYYIAVPAKTLTEKWTLTFITTDDKIYIRQSSNPITFERSKALNLGTFETTKTYWVSGPRGLVSEAQEVDLGLSVTIGTKAYKVIFAKSNLTVTGLAANATDLGDYFAWGAIEPWLTSYTYSGGTFSNLTWKDGKSEGYVIANAPYYDGSASFTKYIDEGTLDAIDDAASVILGGDWQMPTFAIWTALINQITDKYFDTLTKGYKFSKSGETLLFPATGRFYNTAYLYTGSCGNYWSNYTGSTESPDNFYFDNSSLSPNNDDSRFVGYSIRPVRLVEVQSGSFENVGTGDFNWQ